MHECIRLEDYVMSTNEEIVCPWCQTEIVWDPEIGPEDECPHCFNELNDYRSIDLKVKQTGQPLRFDDMPIRMKIYHWLGMIRMNLLINTEKKFSILQTNKKKHPSVQAVMN